MNRIGDDLILERMYAGEQVLLSQADGLDMKAGYFLVVLVFLAQLSTLFLSKSNLTIFTKIDQWIACIALVASGVFLLLELRVASFSVEAALGLEAWRDEVILDAQQQPSYPSAPNLDEYLRKRLVWND